MPPHRGPILYTARMLALRWFLFIFAAINVALGVYWFLVLGAAAGIAYKMPEELALGIERGQGWDVEALRAAMTIPDAAESPQAFARIAAEPAQHLIERVAFGMPLLLASNAVILIATGILLGRARRPQASVPL